MIISKQEARNFENLLRKDQAPSRYMARLNNSLFIKKAALPDKLLFVASIVFFSVIAIFLMLAYVVTFRRKDDSLLPG